MSLHDFGSADSAARFHGTRPCVRVHISDCVRLRLLGEACRRTPRRGAAAACSNFSDEPRGLEEGLPNMTLNLGKYAPQSCETFDTLLEQNNEGILCGGFQIASTCNGTTNDSPKPNCEDLAFVLMRAARNVESLVVGTMASRRRAPGGMRRRAPPLRL